MHIKRYIPIWGRGVPTRRDAPNYRHLTPVNASIKPSPIWGRARADTQVCPYILRYDDLHHGSKGTRP